MGVALLAAYAAALLLAALPRPVRPGWLDAPCAAVERLLRSVGLRGGIAVFLPPRERIDHVLRNDCVRVRGLRQVGPPEILQPPEGRCVTRGLRLYLPSTEWMLRSVLTGGEASHGELMREAVIGDWFCHGRPYRERSFREIEVVWTKPGFDRTSGKERTQNLLFYRWSCDPPDLLAEARNLTDTELRRLVGDE
jgi:hypothetical protein